jgi:predicted amidophosphoribosyltransferase
VLARLLTPLAPPLCAACSGWAGGAEPLCGGCRSLLRWLPREPAFLGALPVWAPVAFDGPARALVHALKFGGAVRAVDVMAAQIVANAPAALLDADALVPVPPHPSRRRRRGFDHAELIAAALGHRSGLPVAACLERSGAAATQVGRGRAERLAGVAGAIAVATGAEVPSRPLLVDDVITTGGTAGACAAALRGAGSSQPAALAYARTPGR